jgi:Family of unknown function (DUF5996)
MQAIAKPATPPGPWPALPLEAWRPTYETLHMWTQVVGKVCLALTPPLNHFWNIAFRVTPRGLSTPVMSTGALSLTFTFDFPEHQLELQRSDGAPQRLPLEPMTVAAFHRLVMEMLDRAGVHVRIWTMPVEVPAPIRFEEDTVRRSYDPASADAFWRVLLAMVPVFEAFRGRFLGKCSPVHFWWGSFDLSCTRFSGRTAPPHPGGVPNLPDWITREAYSHECISAGWWPGNGGGPVREPAFYAYAYPEPPGCAQAAIRPAEASYHPVMREWILPYAAVLAAPSPDALVLDFLASTYESAARLGRWDRAALERGAPPGPGR